MSKKITKKADRKKFYKVKEIWCLLRRYDHLPIPPVDDTGNPYMAFYSEPEAEKSAKWHRSFCRIACYPARVKIA